MQGPARWHSKDSEFDEFSRKIEMARTRWQEETRLPPVKVYPSLRYYMELENREVERQMLQLGSGSECSVYQTFLGQDRPFSTTPLPHLKKGSWWLMDT